MDYHKTLYKNNGINARDGARARISEMLVKSRTDKRMNLLDSKRNIAEITPQVSTAVPALPKVDSRVEMLAKWKAQKQKAMMELKKKQKPVFKVGILQRKATGSPLLKMSSAYADKNFLNPQQIRKVSKALQPSHNGILTRSKAKALENQNNTEKSTKLEEIVNNKRKQIRNHGFTVPKSVSELASKMRVTVPHSPQVLKHSKKLRGKINNTVNVTEVLNVNGMSNIEEEKENIENCQSSEKCENASPAGEKKTDISAEFVPIHYSPFVNKARGSEIKSPRKTKMKLPLDVEELIEKEENEFKCRIFSFRKYIECQTKRLLATCNMWKNEKKIGAKIPDDVEEELLSLYGKTTLLTTDKFMQFKDLINKCENKDPMVKVDDLQGYQDWVAIEVENLDKAFLKLEERKARNWKVEEKQIVKSQFKKETKSLAIRKVTKREGVRSNIREHILAARKLKENAKEISEFQKLDTWIEAKSPVKTPRKSSLLLKDVLTSEAKKIAGSSQKTPSGNVSETRELKKRFSGVEIMAATNMARSLTPSKTPLKNIINEQTLHFGDARTPLKSILKQTPVPISGSKHCVQFRLSGNKINSAEGLGEQFLQPTMDEEYASFLSLKMGEFAMASPHTSNNKHMTSTPIRRSSRLAAK